MRILGIDLGSTSVKAVELDSAFGRYNIHDYHEAPILEGTTANEAVSQLLKSLPKQPDKIVIGLPVAQTTFRNLQLPTRDKKAIQSGVAFELEDELPFSADASMHDYSLLQQTKQSTTVHVAATLKHHLGTNLQEWKSGRVDPDTVTTEAWAYRSLLNRVLAPIMQETPVLLIQMGHEKTTFYLHWKGSPIAVRDFIWGGRDLTTSICQKYDLTVEQAESAKLDRGFVSLPDPNVPVNEEQSEFSKCLEGSLETLLHEVRQIRLTAKNVTQHSVNLIYLSGGTALLPGMAPWMEEKLQTPVKFLRGLSSINTSGVTYSDETDARFLLATSLALTVVGPDRTNCINFRKGEYSKQGRSREINFKVLKMPAIALGTVLTTLFLSLIIQSSVYRSRLAATDIQLEKSVKSFFGQISSSALKTYMANTTALRTSVTKELNKQKELARLFGPNTHSPIDFLNNISTAIPKDVVLDLIQFQGGSSPNDSFNPSEQAASATLTFLVANPQSAERLAALLAGKLGQIQRGKMEEVAQENGLKKWKIVFSGRPTEETYGK